MTTDIDGCFSFCQRLHDRIVASLNDAQAVRAKVDELLPRNSFPESCFCKGCVLPVVDSLATSYLAESLGASRLDVHRALRCEGYDTPLYARSESHVGFSSHSRSNSYHPGDKSGRRAQSRRSPDFCIRHSRLRLVGEVKYVPVAPASKIAQVVRELRDYLSISNEPTSDWGHDAGYGLVYGYASELPLQGTAILEYWEYDRIFLTRLAG